MLLVTAFSVFMFSAQTKGPGNLGSKLEYIGKKDFGGCFLFYCEYPPSTDYFYATDMIDEELKTYFKGASYIEPKPNREDPYYSDYYEDGSAEQEMVFRYAEGKGSIISLNYYRDKRIVETLVNLDRSMDKLYIVRMTGGDQQLFKRVLH